jgi:hypothetical protein
MKGKMKMKSLVSTVKTEDTQEESVLMHTLANLYDIRKIVLEEVGYLSDHPLIKLLDTVIKERLSRIKSF